MKRVTSLVDRKAGFVAAESLLLNISALPPVSVGAAIARLSADLHRCGGIFRLDGIERRPHMTLFMARFPGHRVDAVRRSLDSFRRPVRDTHARHSGFFLTEGNYYEVSYERTEPLMRLHMSLTEMLSPFRYSPGAPVVEEYFAPYTDRQQKNARKWGYDLVGDLYRPHVTITRFSERPGFELPGSALDLSFTISRIGIFEADELGATKRLIQEFTL